MRALVLLLALFALSGCGLPLGVTIASYAADGVSYVATGKSLTDHAISEVADADCAMWRILKNEDPCLTADGNARVLFAFGADPELPKEEAGDAVAAAETPGDTPRLGNVAPAAGAEPGVSGGARGTPAPETSTIVVQDLPPPGASRPAAAPAPGPETAPAAVPATEPDPGAPTILVQDLTPPAASPTSAATRQRAEAPSEVADDGSDGAFADDPPPWQVAARPDSAAASAGAAAPDRRRFLVIGSFVDRANARSLAAAHPRLAPEVVAAEVNGREVFRVVTETAAAEDAAVMRQWLVRDGFADAWPIAACGPGEAGARCLALN